VDEDDLKNILTNKQFLRYQQFFLLASLRNDPTVRWCPRYVVVVAWTTSRAASGLL
jgi:hypothetical protein